MSYIPHGKLRKNKTQKNNGGIEFLSIPSFCTDPAVTSATYFASGSFCPMPTWIRFDHMWDPACYLTFGDYLWDHDLGIQQVKTIPLAEIKSE